MNVLLYFDTGYSHESPHCVTVILSVIGMNIIGVSFKYLFSTKQKSTENQVIEIFHP